MLALTGCCGQAGLSLERYAETFPVMEIQYTFYRLPRLTTAEGWRKRAPNLVFTVKAFQGVSHPITSPTWKRAGGQRPREGGENFGHLSPSKEVFDCWRRTLEVCRALAPPVCVVQMPPSFEMTPEHVKRAEAFFSSKVKEPRVALELRHPSWFKDPEALSHLLRRVDVTHVVDPLVRPPAHVTDFAYYRLHGLGPRLDYRYKYTANDLQRLREAIERSDEETVYVLFNNLEMSDDASRLMKLMAR